LSSSGFRFGIVGVEYGLEPLRALNAQMAPNVMPTMATSDSKRNLVLLMVWFFFSSPNVKAHTPLTVGERRNSGKVELP
jgi:hypothetical protein